MYLELHPNGQAVGNNPSSTSITDVELEIGGQKIDKQSGTGWKHGGKLTEPNPYWDNNGGQRRYPGQRDAFSKMSCMGWS